LTPAFYFRSATGWFLTNSTPNATCGAPAV
jgi:hypothetical protein